MHRKIIEDKIIRLQNYINNQYLIYFLSVEDKFQDFYGNSDLYYGNE